VSECVCVCVCEREKETMSGKKKGVGETKAGEKGKRNGEESAFLGALAPSAVMLAGSISDEGGFYPILNEAKDDCGDHPLG